MATAGERPSRAPIYLGICSIFVSFAALAVSGFIAITGIETQHNAAAGTFLAMQAWNCSQFENWTIDRIHDGMTDQSIADLTPIARSDGVSVKGVDRLPDAAVATTAQSLDPSFLQLISPGSDNGTLYGSCGFKSVASLAAWVATIRADLNQVPQPTPGG